MIMSGNEGLRRTEYGNTGGVQLLKVIHQIQVGKRATAFVDIVIAVGSDGDGANVGDARHVRWNELFQSCLRPVARSSLLTVAGTSPSR